MKKDNNATRNDKVQANRYLIDMMPPQVLAQYLLKLQEENEILREKLALELENESNKNKFNITSFLRKTQK